MPLRKKPLTSISSRQRSNSVTGKTVEVDQLDSEIKKIIEEYSENMLEALQFTIEKYAALIIEEIERTAPKSNRFAKIHLRDSFFYDTDQSARDLVATIFSPDKGFLAHFIEYGTTKMSARPFMRPAYDKLVPEMVKEINQIIERGGL